MNTGGKKLDAFELLTAIYAADGFKLRQDWLGESKHIGRYARLVSKHPILRELASTDFMQAVSLLHTKAVRDRAAAEGSSDLPAVSCTRNALLNLPLTAYQTYADRVEEGLAKAAKFLRAQKVYGCATYRTNAAYSAGFHSGGYRRPLGPSQSKKKITRWYLERSVRRLYGSTTESRYAKDFVEVPIWLEGGDEPSTIKDVPSAPTDC